MNPVQVIEAARPEIHPMPPVERRHLRERLFDVGTRTQTDHSPLEVASANTRWGNAVRLGALALLGGGAVAGLIFSASRDTPAADGSVTPVTGGPAPVETEPVRDTVLEGPRPTMATTTTVAPVAGTDETPLVLPPERNRLDELVVTRMQLGGSALLLRADDLSTISLREADGVAPEPPGPPTTDEDGAPVTTLPPRQFSAVSIAPPDEDTPSRYVVPLACGTLEVTDVAGFPPFRPELTQLFDSMTFADGQIRLALPEGWAALSSGPSTDEFTFGLPVEIGERNVTVTLAQYPGGSLAVAGYDDVQYSPTTFGGEPALIHRDAANPDDFTLVTMLGTTAIKASATDLSLEELTELLAGLQPGDVDDWARRFGALPATVDPDIRTCAEQPEFVLE